MAFSHSPNIVTDGLVLCLDAADKNSFTSGSTTWTDLSGNGLNGTLSAGTLGTVSGSNVIAFDGADDYVSLTGSSKYYFGSSDFSVEAWAKGTSDGTSIALHRNSAVTRYINLEIDSNKARLLMWKHPASYSIGTGTSTITDNVWHHIVGTRIESVPAVYIYVDGVLEGSGADNAVDAPESSNWYLASQVGTDKFLKGSISNFRLYNKALTSKEVLQNFNAQRARFGV